ncbi:hypothetical protein LZD49_28650, partial [Dyadobacter sp. CY261]|uniref:hypothetical protein n=1 Tax=Dyadobacter sp. CY261 TaxID=2907203 RepID=UPI001F157A15
MKNLLIAVLLACCQMVSAQSIDQIIDSKIKASEARQKAYSDSLFKLKGPGIPKCDQGPSVVSISGITTSGLTANITGEGLTRINVSIFNEDSTVNYYSKTFAYNSPENAITYNLSPGKYRLYASGVSCTGYGSRAFTIKTPEAGKPDCPRGPTLWAIQSPTPTSLVFQFDGDGVFGIDYEILNSAGNKVAGGSAEPKSSLVTASGFLLADGEYKLRIKGGTCNNKKPEEDSKAIPFTIKSSTGGPAQPNDKGAKFEFIMGTTGGGFRPDEPTGIDRDWVERIEAFKYNWGYGITGISLWVEWTHYEPTPGHYRTDGLQKVIKFCRDRGLKLAITFKSVRSRGDNFIREDEIVKGSAGTLYAEGPGANAHVYAGYGNDRVNALSYKAIQSIAKELKTYDRALYIAISGGGSGEVVNHTFEKNGLWEVADVSQ